MASSVPRAARPTATSEAPLEGRLAGSDKRHFVTSETAPMMPRANLALCDSYVVTGPSSSAETAVDG